MLPGILKISGLAAALALAGFVASPAAARDLQRCDQAHCYTVHCQDGVCTRRSYEYGRYMNNRDYDYDHTGYYDDEGNFHHTVRADPIEHYLCDRSGERCHWGRAYEGDEHESRDPD